MNQTYPEAQRINELIGAADNIVIIQADNPDTDSLGSALALEQILSDMGKTVEMYCAVNIPSYLRYISGWDRVQIDFPKNFELSIIVDTGASNLLKVRCSGINDNRKFKIFGKINLNFRLSLIPEHLTYWNF